MYIERMHVERFRHLKEIELGPFRAPSRGGELIVLAGPNGGGKSSVLELLALGLASRYSYAFYQTRQMTDHSFAIKIGLTDSELQELESSNPEPDVMEYARRSRGYWIQVNMPSVLPPAEVHLNERTHALVSQKFANHSRRLGFWVRSERSYSARNYDSRNIFNYRAKEQPQYLSQYAYRSTTEQYDDMYDYLLEQSYHFVYQLGLHLKRQQRGESSQQPVDPLLPYNELLGRLFPGYRFEDVADQQLVLRVRLPNGVVIPFQDMSSGEKEVFFILAFFLRHNIANSIIVVDEPELHLHPELGRRLVQLMRGIRSGNQLWMATHSPELIDEAGRERTFFIRRRPDAPTEAECRSASNAEEELLLLRDMFGYSGFVGITKKIVFTEGSAASADRKTFVSLFPEVAEEIKIIPVGSAGSMERLNRAILSLLASDFARCDFYSVRDRDFLSPAAIQKLSQQGSGKMFILERHEIENYLLDEDVIRGVLADVFQQAWTTEQVRDSLISIARGNSAAFLRDMVVARYADLFQQEDCSIGSHSAGQEIQDAFGKSDDNVVTTLMSALRTRVREAGDTIAARLSPSETDRIFDECYTEVASALDPGRDRWKIIFPGKHILQRFASQNNLGRWPGLQNLIIERMAEAPPANRGDLYPVFEAIAGHPLVFSPSQ